MTVYPCLMTLLRLLALLLICVAGAATAQDYDDPGAGDATYVDAPPPVRATPVSGAETAAGGSNPATDDVLAAPDETDTGDASAQPAELYPDEPPPPGVPATAPPPTVTAPATTIVPAAPRVIGGGASGSVEIGTLGTTEGPTAGTLDDTNGGLGAGLWNGVHRDAAVRALATLPPLTSPTARMLVRRLLLTSAPPPAGQSDVSFNAARIRTLLGAGLLPDAAAIAAQVRAPKDPETSRAQADAFLFANDDAGACGEATAMRFDSDDPFWMELRAYCYALAKDPALEFTRAVMGNADPAFNALLDGVIAGKPHGAVAFANPTALHVRMMRRLNLPMTAGVANIGAPGAFIAAQSATTPRGVRVAAGEKAFLAGALAPAVTARIADLVPVDAADLPQLDVPVGVDRPFIAIARLRAALKLEADPVRRAALIHRAMELGKTTQLFYQVAPVFADDAAAIQPRSDLARFMWPIVHGLVASGKYDAAQRWSAIFPANGPNGIAVVLAIALGDPAHQQQAQAMLVQSADPALAADDRVLVGSALILGLFDALEMPMPPEAQARLQTLAAIRMPGRRPSADLTQRIEAASAAGRRGETVLAVLMVLGRGPGDLAPDVVAQLVRALQHVGMREAARMLATEALLTS